MEFLDIFFDTQGFMPHGSCILWRPEIIYPRIAADLLTGLAYFAAAAGVVVFLIRRKDVPYRPFFVLYGSLIFIACGGTHFMGVWTLWHPDYGIETVIMVITAATSVAASVILWPLIPRLVALPTPALLKQKNQALEREIGERERANAEVRLVNDNLESLVAERTDQLGQANTELQQKVIELHQAHDLLEQRVAERTDELSQSVMALKEAQSRLVEAEKMASLSSVVAGVAHEINTPLGVGITAASLIQDWTDGLAQQYEAGTLERAYLNEYVQDTQQASRSILSNLQRASHQLEDFKQLAADQFIDNNRRFHLKSYLQELLASLDPKLKDIRVRLSCPESLELISDPGAISQVITNLLMNSIIHGFENKPDGEIEIAVTTNDDQITLTYQDSGCGMTAEQLKLIYEPFYTTRRGKGGTGLGMSITYNLITQRLGGQISCSSEPSKGLRISISLAGLVS
ncbi:MAG: ATP-binding protein [Motiliproteus sp.]